ncbi:MULTISPECIES: helix-turn-helix domain-containing protein [Mycobacterium]|uniref:helix-turn-helix domain-containing protein n=1 Tax=Mycobacterium TaxID=1763 RepID=UPI001CD9ADF5|nr:MULTISPECIES: helix-turn-helix transcriptional regulator [Mycobacterium]MCA2241309.1 helix-turn-helix transcriptional regulator [Mycobacterium sp. WUMAC-067]MCA2317523.1 helix-turn-helix transcriptional regulator [Mycobacterium sp. WUMAC-025]MEE3751610.1 helix-turn-helix transcriptional regulator [Mycobacterium intracellulare]
MTLAPDRRTPPPPRRPAPQQRNRGNGPSEAPSGSLPDLDQPVEFWPTSAIRSALQGGDIATWKRIAGALKRDPYGRTARQVEEVVDGTRPYGIAKALWEVLERARAHLDANERAEVARHVRLLVDRSGLAQREFASRIGVSAEELGGYLDGSTSPTAALMIRIRRLSDRFVKVKSGRSAESN